MAWIKIPEENKPLFLQALPKDPRVSTIHMFGGIAGLVNGNMFAGLFARSAMVRLSPTDQQQALTLDGAAPFDPMGNGRIMKDTIMLPDSVMDELDELRSWLRRALDYSATLPKKVKKKPKQAVKKPLAKKTVAKKPVANKPVAKKRKIPKPRSR